MTQQVDAIHMAFQRGESVEVEAGAGTGKTTLIVSGQHYLPRNTLFLAFNKSVADELTSRLPGRMCKTFHAIALRNLTSRVGKLPVNGYKYSKLAEQVGCSRDEANAVKDILEKFQVYAEGCFVEPSDWTAGYIKSVIGENDLWDIEVPENSSLDYLLGVASEVLQKEAKKLTGLSFSDMLFFLVHFAVKKRWSLRDYDCVVVDESQDVSPIRLEIVKRLSNRVVHVGDRRQGIYGFAGAMHGAMDSLTEAFGCTRYPLSTTWRCATSIIEEASTIVGDFLQPRPNAPAGSVTERNEGFLYQSYLDNNSMVICRTNAPLVKIALTLMNQGTQFHFMSDYPEKLAKRADKIAQGVSGMAAFKTAVNEWLDSKLEGVKSENLIKRIEDEVECILVVARRTNDPSDVGAKLREISYHKHGVLLTTGHKAKGLEAQNVYILRPDLIPAPWVDPSDDEKYQQELNLKYVMITRAKDNLIYLTPEE